MPSTKLAARISAAAALRIRQKVSHGERCCLSFDGFLTATDRRWHGVGRVAFLRSCSAIERSEIGSVNRPKIGDHQHSPDRPAPRGGRGLREKGHGLTAQRPASLWLRPTAATGSHGFSSGATAGESVVRAWRLGAGGRHALFYTAAGTHTPNDPAVTLPCSLPFRELPAATFFTR